MTLFINMSSFISALFIPFQAWKILAIPTLAIQLVVLALTYLKRFSRSDDLTREKAYLSAVILICNSVFCIALISSIMQKSGGHHLIYYSSIVSAFLFLLLLTLTILKLNPDHLGQFNLVQAASVTSSLACTSTWFSVGHAWFDSKMSFYFNIPSWIFFGLWTVSVIFLISHWVNLFPIENRFGVLSFTKKTISVRGLKEVSILIGICLMSIYMFWLGKKFEIHYTEKNNTMDEENLVIVDCGFFRYSNSPIFNFLPSDRRLNKIRNSMLLRAKIKNFSSDTLTNMVVAFYGINSKDTVFNKKFDLDHIIMPETEFNWSVELKELPVHVFDRCFVRLEKPTETGILEKRKQMNPGHKKNGIFILE